MIKRKSELMRLTLDNHLAPVNNLFDRDCNRSVYLCNALGYLSYEVVDHDLYDIIDDMKKEICYQIELTVGVNITARSAINRLKQRESDSETARENSEEIQAIRFMFGEFLALMWEDEEAAMQQESDND